MDAQYNVTQINERLARTEAAVESLATDVTNIVSSVRDLSTTLTGTINDIRSKLDSTTKTDWKMLAGWAAVIIAFMGLLGGAVGTGYLRDLQRIETGVTELRSNEFERGKRAQQLEDQQIYIKKLDDDLQREIQERDVKNKEQFELLDKRLENEIITAFTNQEKEQGQIRDDLSRVRDRVDKIIGR